ncbi:MAG: hypothetical protein MZV70_35205 [Desulfobacterales bacterium]|nr:hypothetical protein [Desulfobacterales bacterium]
MHHTPLAAGAFDDRGTRRAPGRHPRPRPQLGSGGDDKVPPLDRSAWDLLRLKTSSLDAIMAAMLDEFDDIGSFLRYEKTSRSCDQEYASMTKPHLLANGGVAGRSGSAPTCSASRCFGRDHRPHHS